MYGMITNLEIKGFQSWKDLSVTFSPGVNVFVGESDSGKSAIIRALRWLFLNRPTGDAFRNNSLKGKEFTQVNAIFDPSGTKVSRQRNNKTNAYLVDQIEYKALRSDVPEEVQSITKMQDENIQSQHEQYFLLDKSPGQVSKELNKVAGLDLMDDALQDINSKIRETGKQDVFLTENINQAIENIDSLDWVEEAEEELKVIQSHDALISKMEQELGTGQKLIRQIDGVNKELQEYHFINSAKKALQGLNASQIKIRKMELSQQTLQKHIKTANRATLEQKRYKGMAQAERTLKKLNSKFAESVFNQKVLAINAIESRIRLNTNALARIEILNTQIDQKKKEFHDALKELKICPLCGGKV